MAIVYLGILMLIYYIYKYKIVLLSFCKIL